MTFEYPVVAALLFVALPPAAWLVWREGKRRKLLLQEFGEPSLLAQGSSLQRTRDRRAADWIRLAVLSLAILALARPQLGQRPASLVQFGRDLLVVLDLSRSMNAQDVAESGQSGTTRLELAKRAIETVLAGSPGDRVGLVIFGGSAFLQLPLTEDHAAFGRYLAAASTDDLADPATDLSRALITAATTFEHEGERGHRAVLLISDGESVRGNVEPALTRLRRLGVPVFALGVGSAEGGAVPGDSIRSGEPWHRDHIGRIVYSRLEEGELRRTARETNGFYLTWTTGSERVLRTEMERVERRTMSSRSSPQPADRFQWPLGLAIMLIAIDPLLGLRRRRA